MSPLTDITMLSASVLAEHDGSAFDFARSWRPLSILPMAIAVVIACASPLANMPCGSLLKPRMTSIEVRPREKAFTVVIIAFDMFVTAPGVVPVRPNSAWSDAVGVSCAARFFDSRFIETLPTPYCLAMVERPAAALRPMNAL